MSIGRDGCRWVDARLPLLAGGELRGLDRRRVERHLIGCAGCRDRLTRLETALEALHLSSQLDPSPAHSEPLWPALERHLRESRREPRSPWKTWGPLAASLLTVASALGLGAWGLSQQYQIVFRPRPYPSVQIAKRPPRPVIRTVSNASLRRELVQDAVPARTKTQQATSSTDRLPPIIPTN